MYYAGSQSIHVFTICRMKEKNWRIHGKKIISFDNAAFSMKLLA